MYLFIVSSTISASLYYGIDPERILPYVDCAHRSRLSVLGQADTVQDGVEESVVYCFLVGTTLTAQQEHRMVLFIILLCPSWEEL